MSEEPDDEGGEIQPTAKPRHRSPDALPLTLHDYDKATLPTGWTMSDVLEAICMDPVARRRGVRLVRLHFADWQRLGEPINATMPSSLGCFDHVYSVQVQPTGRRADWVRWLYRREKDGTPARLHHRPKRAATGDVQ